MELHINEEVKAERANVKISIEIYQPSPEGVGISTEGAEAALIEMYEFLAGTLASYLCAGQTKHEENPESGMKHFNVLFKHIVAACNEELEMNPEAIDKKEKLERDSLIYIQ